MGIKDKLKQFFFPNRSKFKHLHRKMEDANTHLLQLLSLAEAKYGFKLPPVPPKHLQTRVAGCYSPNFFQNGVDMLREIQEILRKHGLEFFGFDRILDFGCGCGRTIIPFSLMADPSKMSGTDIDPEAIGWLKQNFSSFRDLDVNNHNPPTKYQTGEFEFIYSISIFTHLPEDMQNVWLKELSRIMKPGGHGLFTTHGENYFVHLDHTARAKLAEKGFCYSDLGATEGLPDFYRVSFQTKEYVRHEWAKYFDVVAIYEKGICQNQDAVLVRRLGE